MINMSIIINTATQVMSVPVAMAGRTHCMNWGTYQQAASSDNNDKVNNLRHAAVKNLISGVHGVTPV